MALPILHDSAHNDWDEKAMAIKSGSIPVMKHPGAAEEVSTGTTIISVAFNGGVVMGADTRTSAGGYVVNRASRKITKLHDRIFVCRSGSAADTQALAGFVTLYLSQHYQELGEAPRVKAAAQLFKLMSYHNKDNLMAGTIVAGWDKRHGGQVYAIPLGGTMVRLGYSIGGSGSGYITALLDTLWRPTMSKDECRKLVKKAVAHAMIRDGSSGGMIRVVTITQSAVEEESLDYDHALKEAPFYSSYVL